MATVTSPGERSIIEMLQHLLPRQSCCSDRNKKQALGEETDAAKWRWISGRLWCHWWRLLRLLHSMMLPDEGQTCSAAKPQNTNFIKKKSCLVLSSCKILFGNLWELSYKSMLIKLYSFIIYCKPINTKMCSMQSNADIFLNLSLMGC